MYITSQFHSAPKHYVNKLGTAKVSSTFQGFKTLLLEKFWLSSQKLEPSLSLREKNVLRYRKFCRWTKTVSSDRKFCRCTRWFVIQWPTDSLLWSFCYKQKKNVKWRTVPELLSGWILKNFCTIFEIRPDFTTHGLSWSCKINSNSLDFNIQKKTPF